VMVIFPAAVRIQFYITRWEDGVVVRLGSVAAARVLHGHD
jgi:hypothetical protein